MFYDFFVEFLHNFIRLLDVISKLGLQKSSVLQHMTTVIHRILEKGILDYSIIHTVLVEYFTIADKVILEILLQTLHLLTARSSDMSLFIVLCSECDSTAATTSRSRIHWHG